MAATDAKIERYPFTRPFEIMVAFAEASIPRFHDFLGYAIDPEKLPSADCRLLVSAAQGVARETGAGCPSTIVASQNLRRTVDAGKVTHEQLQEVEDLIQLAQDLGGVPDLDALLSEASPVIKRLAQREAVAEAIKDFGRGEDIDTSLHRFEQVAVMGRARVSLGTTLPGTSDDIFATMKPMMRTPLPTGIAELDLVLDGGVERQSLAMIMASTGGGKSLFLGHQAAEALTLGYDVAYMTLEMSEMQLKRRIYANLLDMTVDEMEARPHEAARRFNCWRENGLGNLYIMYSTPRATTPGTVRRWLKALEQEKKIHPELLIIDYADKMVSSLKSNKQVKHYEEMEVVYEDLRSIAVERDGWTWTASQTNRSGLHKKTVDLEHVSDSANKPRVCDVVLSISRTAEDERENMLRFRIPKRRENQAHQEVGPLSMDAAHGRIAMSTRNDPW